MGGANYPYFLAFRSAEFWHTSASSRRLAHSAGDSPARARVRSPVAWVADRRETKCSEADWQSHLRDGERVTGPQRKWTHRWPRNKEHRPFRLRSGSRSEYGYRVQASGGDFKLRQRSPAGLTSGLMGA